jgi:uncharacterized protein YgbK (DUF1537 family)
MTNEQFEKQVAFILGQQAQFEVDIQLLQEAQTRTEQVVARNAEAISQVSQAVVETTSTVARLAEVTSSLAEATHERFNDVAGKINVLIDSQMRTDETVRNLAATVDRHLRRGRNGQNN